MRFNTLTDFECRVIEHKATESPGSGLYYHHFEEGIYQCKRCSSTLYDSSHKFKMTCGWPSFDDCFNGSITKQLDSDGRRIEIVCATCKGHLGHVFNGEQLTDKNTRHCVNSVSLVFIKRQ
jgi:methionine-R-sulfoxide reductase